VANIGRINGVIALYMEQPDSGALNNNGYIKVGGQAWRVIAWIAGGKWTASLMAS